VSTLPTDEMIGARVGQYRITSALGAGGMGQVYRATGPDGREVAIKLIRGRMASDPVYRKRFDREVRIAQQVSDPHLVPVIDTGELDGRPYLVAPFVRGGSLEDLLRTEGRLAVETTLSIASDVAAGLGALAAEGMVHRDIKPANIVLDLVGTARLTDFGLVRSIDGSTITRLGQALGSPHYMAPEQIRGEQVTPAADVYSLGCVVATCLRGEPPFAPLRGLQLMSAQLTDAPPDPCLGRADTPVGLGAAVLRALIKPSSERPADAREYVASLYAAAGIRPGARQ
jgi:serine/threonine-protein kinase